MTPLPRPPQEQFLITYKDVDLFLYDATREHRRKGWNHHQDKYCLVEWDQFPNDRDDRGTVGNNLEDPLLYVKAIIDHRKKKRIIV